MAKCDICGKQQSASSMSDLRSCYQTATVKDVCTDCENWANKQLDEIRNANAPELRRRIAERVNEKTKPPLWRRIFKPCKLPTQ